MSFVRDGVLYVEREPPAPCEQCGTVAELRPYGFGGRRVCNACASKDPTGTVMRYRQYVERMGAHTICLLEPAALEEQQRPLPPVHRTPGGRKRSKT